MSARGQAGLVADLEAMGERPFAQEMVVRARANEWHDFKGPHAAPKIHLVETLLKYGMKGLAKKAMMGEYDDHPGPEDLEALADTVAATGHPEDKALADAVRASAQAERKKQN